MMRIFLFAGLSLLFTLSNEENLYAQSNSVESPISDIIRAAGEACGITRSNTLSGKVTGDILKKFNGGSITLEGVANIVSQSVSSELARIDPNKTENFLKISTDCIVKIVGVSLNARDDVKQKLGITALAEDRHFGTGYSIVNSGCRAISSKTICSFRIFPGIKTLIRHQNGTILRYNGSEFKYSEIDIAGNVFVPRVGNDFYELSADSSGGYVNVSYRFPVNLPKGAAADIFFKLHNNDSGVSLKAIID